MTILNRDDFLSTSHLKRELVEVPELGGAIYVRELNTAQYITFKDKVDEYREGEKKSAEASVRLMALLVVFSVCNEQGEDLFTVDDVDKLMRLKISVLEKIADKALELSNVNPNGEVNSNLKNAPKISSSINSARNSKRRLEK